MGENAILTLDKRIEDPVDLYVGDQLVARGLLEEVEGDHAGQLAVRLTEIADLQKRDRLMRTLICRGWSVPSPLMSPSLAAAQELSPCLWATESSISATDNPVDTADHGSEPGPGAGHHDHVFSVSDHRAVDSAAGHWPAAIAAQHAVGQPGAMFLTYFIMEPVFSEAWTTWASSPMVEETDGGGTGA